MDSGYKKNRRYIRWIETCEGKTLMSPANDFTFKMLFGDENNKDILVSFLSAVLRIKPEKFTGLELMNTELTREFAEDRSGILDVRVRLSDGSQIDIEIQLSGTKYMAERTLYYWSRMFTSNIESGDSYSKLKRCVTINILDFYATTIKKIYSKFHITEADTGEKLTDVLEIYYLELPKLRDSELINTIDDNNPIIQWMTFLAADNKEVLDMLSQTSPEIKRATNILEVMSKDKEARMRYEAREAQLHDEATALEEAREEGKIEAIKTFLKNGMKIEDIMKYTDLSLAEVEDINRHINN